MEHKCRLCHQPLTRVAFVCDECRDKQDTRWKRVQDKWNKRVHKGRKVIQRFTGLL